MTKRRATSPAPQSESNSGASSDAGETSGRKRARLSSEIRAVAPEKGTNSKPESSNSNEDSGSELPGPDAGARKLSANAPVFVPSSASTSPVVSKPKPAPAPKLTQTTLGSASKDASYLRPTFKSSALQIKDSTFQARLFHLSAPHPSQRTKIQAYMKRTHPDFQHHMTAWRFLILKEGMTGLEGEDAFKVEQGCDDDGETRAGKAVLDVIEKMGLCDVVVIVSRRFGGTMLGPARFTYIADCARAVCSALYEREKAAERASKVADLVAQLREWDTDVAELRSEMAALEPQKVTTPDEKQPTISVSLKAPDYSNILEPPDVEKAERLLAARQKTVQSLKAALEKKRQAA